MLLSFLSPRRLWYSHGVVHVEVVIDVMRPDSRGFHALIEDAAVPLPQHGAKEHPKDPQQIEQHLLFTKALALDLTSNPFDEPLSYPLSVALVFVVS